MANALFSTAMLLLLAGVHWWKMRSFRTHIESRLDALITQFAPVPTALAKLTTGFLSEKIDELDRQVSEVQVRVEHIEVMIEQSQVPPAVK